ncbi:MAG: hypothetical protein DRI94_05275 [Bacteroidetes bacterium]|nr:hypothetical protein [Bacteroidales bacterium]RLD51714.1 MAG: hypothetical protein DRI94_05275 [Bacteroidota bacterium]
MGNYIISIPDSKKHFFLSLIKELKFIKIKSEYTEKEEIEYIDALELSEKDISEGKIISNSDLKNEVLKWK